MKKYMSKYPNCKSFTDREPRAGLWQLLRQPDPLRVLLPGLQEGFPGPVHREARQQRQVGTLRTVAEMEIVLRARARGDKHGAIIIKRWDTVVALCRGSHCNGPGTCLLFYLFIFICLRRSRGLWELCRLYIFLFSFVMIIQTMPKVEIVEGGSQSGN